MSELTSRNTDNAAANQDYPRGLARALKNEADVLRDARPNHSALLECAADALKEVAALCEPSRVPLPLLNSKILRVIGADRG